jgi:hypothetical protein
MCSRVRARSRPYVFQVKPQTTHGKKRANFSVGPPQAGVRLTADPAAVSS